MASSRTKVALAVTGASLISIALIVSIFLNVAGWPKWVLILVGVLMVMPLWDTFAGTSSPKETQPKIEPMESLEKYNFGDPMQDIWGCNGHDIS